MAGTLYIVPTPVGNLDDLSPRARGVLAAVALVACEDTRRTGRLLRRLELRTPMLSCHKFNERRRIEPVLQRLLRGEDVALVTDSGTPCIRDPGAKLVRAAWETGVRICPLPGPSAVVVALSASGFAADRFRFEGFLPPRRGPRLRRLRALATCEEPLVIFEAPHRLRATLEDLEAVLGARTILLGRELTKLHETLLRGTPRELLRMLGEKPVRGEITLVVEGAALAAAAPPPEPDRALAEAWQAALDAADGHPRTALRQLAKRLGRSRAELYRELAQRGLLPPRR